MVSFMGLLLDGQGDPIGEAWAAALGELKTRGLVRQTRAGRPMPTEKGRSLWADARAARARAALRERPDAGRPYLVVFDAKGRGRVFTDWIWAVRHAKSVVSANPGAFGALRSPEDAIELWKRAHLAPSVAEAADRTGTSEMDAETEGTENAE